MRKVLISIVLLTAIHATGFSQTGPGGISTADGTGTLELWFDSRDVNGNGTNPDVAATVATWVDKSGNDVDITENIANVATYSNPGVTFNNTGYLLGDDTGLPGGNASRTVFIVASTPNTGEEDGIFFYGNPSPDNSFGVLKRYNNDVRFYFFDNDLDDVNGWAPVNDTKVIGAKYTSGTPGFMQVFVDGTQSASGTPSATPNTTTGTIGLQIGGWSQYSFPSNATIYEVLFYSSAVNDAQRYILDNYLAAKYGQSLTSHDLYDEDNNVNGDYDYEVAGIGRVDASNIHNDAQGPGVVRMLNANGLDDDEFLIWGHDNGILQASETVDVPAGVEARFDRVWRVSEVNTSNTAVDVGSLDMRWDLSALNPVISSDLVLLVDTDNDGSFNDEAPITGATDLGGGVYEFPGVTAIANNLRFTLGTTNATQTPLPVELALFEAHVMDNNSVRLEWRTASELHNDFFTIERSVDGLGWEEVNRINGSGNSSSLISYTAYDTPPFSGTFLYRLKQTDFDEQYTYSEIRRVNIDKMKGSQLLIYPNPFQNQINIQGQKADFDRITVHNIFGEDVTSRIKQVSRDESMIVFEMSALSPGVYYVKAGTTSTKVLKQ